MARKVIKGFLDLQDYRKKYIVDSVYSGKREKELFELGYLGDEVELETPSEATELTVSEIKKLLDGKGIEYKANAKKADLLALLGE